MATEATRTDDGGPAFPCATDRVIVDTKDNKIIPVCGGGMSLRDYFAAKAMAAIVGTHTEVNRVEFAREMGFEEADADLGGFNEDMAMDCGGLAIAEWAYKIADTMISQRKAVPQ